MNALRRPFRYTYCNATLVLIGVNAAVFLLQFVLRQNGPDYVTFFLSMNPFNVVKRDMYWQLFTYMFVHSPGGWSHILFNMLALFIFGTALERHIGSREFVLYYLVTGTAAGILSFITYLLMHTNPFLLGASGAIFGIQLAYAAFFPNSYVYFWGLLPLRAPVMVLLFTAIELVSGLAGLGGNVAHFTHLFGFLAGILYFFIRWDANPFKMMFSR